MCGIVGVWDKISSLQTQHANIQPMLDAIAHRGPDAEGIWQDQSCNLTLGHRRLAVLDLSEAGSQPMQSVCNRFVLVFNGEIYNHLDLRRRLENDHLMPAGGWRGHSDTETLLACFAAWGIENTLKATVGMFAIALWDVHDKTLTLARDRIGEKPLYYGFVAGRFMFGSELKSLRAHSVFKSDVDWNSVDALLRHNAIPAPASVFQNVKQLLPGAWVSLSLSELSSNVVPPVKFYWSLHTASKSAEPFDGTFEDAVSELNVLLKQAVALQSVADVPVGAFLSGGIDSSTVAALMQLQSGANVTTFCIGMPDKAMDESKLAASVAEHLGTQHVEHMITPAEALDVIPKLVSIWDEPFADSSQIPTYLVSKLAKQQVVVALSGDGGDEFFLGYPHYALVQKFYNTRAFNIFPWRAVSLGLKPFDRFGRMAQLHRRMRTVTGAWRAKAPSAMLNFFKDNYRDVRTPLMQIKNQATPQSIFYKDAARSAALWEAGGYLPNDILVKVDRAAMSHSLETRAPLLDHRVVEFALSLPTSFLLTPTHGKHVLREVLYKYVPKHLVNRPKTGFSIPLANWLRHELNGWATNLLQNAKHYDMLDNELLQDLWAQHQSGARDHTDALWAVLALLGFLEAL